MDTPIDQTFHDEFSDEDVANHEGYQLSDHELDSKELNKMELKKAADNKFTFDCSCFPRIFRTIDDALDTYNQLGYQNKIQFKLYEHKS